MAWVVRGVVLVAYLFAFQLITGLAAGSAGRAVAIATTAAVAVTLAPTQRAADRWVAERLGRPTTPYDALVGLGARLGSPGPLDAVGAEIARATLHATGTTRVELRLEGDEAPLASWGADEPPLSEEDKPLLIPLRDGADALGTLTLWPAAAVTPGRRALVEDLANAAGPALRAARLSAELATRRDERRLQTERLRQARHRVVTEHDAERRRLERDIHDGAQQHIVQLLVQLGMLSAGVGRVPDARRALRKVFATLRGLSSGLAAPHVELGLPRALREAAPAGAVIQVDETLGLTRDAEAALYFGCAEALQNAAKHAAGAEVSVTVTALPRSVRAVVRDRGPGFTVDGTTDGRGLGNLRARVDEVGGSVVVQSRRGRGTAVVIEVPR